MTTSPILNNRLILGARVGAGLPSVQERLDELWTKDNYSQGWEQSVYFGLCRAKLIQPMGFKYEVVSLSKAESGVSLLRHVVSLLPERKNICEALALLDLHDATEMSVKGLIEGITIYGVGEKEEDGIGNDAISNFLSGSAKGIFEPWHDFEGRVFVFSLFALNSLLEEVSDQEASFLISEVRGLLAGLDHEAHQGRLENHLDCLLQRQIQLARWILDESEKTFEEVQVLSRLIKASVDLAETLARGATIRSKWFESASRLYFEVESVLSSKSPSKTPENQAWNTVLVSMCNFK